MPTPGPLPLLGVDEIKLRSELSDPMVKLGKTQNDHSRAVGALGVPSDRNNHSASHSKLIKWVLNEILNGLRMDNFETPY